MAATPTRMPAPQPAARRQRRAAAPRMTTKIRTTAAAPLTRSAPRPARARRAPPPSPARARRAHTFTRRPVPPPVPLQEPTRPVRTRRERSAARPARVKVSKSLGRALDDPKCPRRTRCTKSGGREWQPKGEPERVDVHDFPSDAVGKAIPFRRRARFLRMSCRVQPLPNPNLQPLPYTLLGRRGRSEDTCALMLPPKYGDVMDAIQKRFG
jgi:hypothetical protein